MLKGLIQSRNTREERRATKSNSKQLRKWQQGHIYIAILTLNINGVNAPNKRHRLAEWIKKQDPYIGSLQETNFQPQDIQTECERMEN